MRRIKYKVVKVKNIGTGVETDIPAIKGEGINYDAEIDQLATEIEDLNNQKASKDELEETNQALSELQNTEIPTIKADLSELEEALGVETIEIVNMLGSDGNFANVGSSSGWYKAYGESTASASDGVLTFNANRQFGSLRKNLSFVAGHKYYFFGTFKASSTSVSININTETPLLYHSGNNEFEFVSGIRINNTTSTYAMMILDATSGTQSTIQAKKFGIIDLTETFGEGNEPSKDYMDILLHKLDDFILNYSLISIPRVAKGYENKKILYMGDSITAYNLQDNGWCKYFNEIVSPRKSVNVAVSGATWCDKEGTVYNGNPSTYDSTNNVIGNQVEKIIRGKDTENPNYSHNAEYDEFDVIIIACGTNDTNDSFVNNDVKSAMVDARWGSPLPLDQADRKTPSGAMRYAYEKLYALYPNARFYFCTPIQTYPSKKVFGEIQKKGDVIKEMARYIPIHAIDTEQCGIYGNREQYSTMGVDLIDGLHPSPSGAKKMGVYNANAFIADYLAN